MTASAEDAAAEDANAQDATEDTTAAAEGATNGVEDANSTPTIAEGVEGATEGADDATPVVAAADDATEGVAAAEHATEDATGSPEDVEVVEVDHNDLLGELARAMHATATAQAERLNAELERRRVAQAEATAARASSEVENLKSGSAADIRGIDAWAKAETEQIKQERLRRIEARREQLTRQLERQETIREREVAAVDSAIDAHRNEVELFFGRLEREADPAAIAHVASTLPPFPPLAEIADNARQGAAAEFSNVVEKAEPAAPATRDAPRDVHPDTTRDAAHDVDSEGSISQSRLMSVMDPGAASRGGNSADARPWDGEPYAISIAAGPPLPDDDRPRLRPGATLLRAIPSIRPMAARLDPGNELPDAQH